MCPLIKNVNQKPRAEISHVHLRRVVAFSRNPRHELRSLYVNTIRSELSFLHARSDQINQEMKHKYQYRPPQPQPISQDKKYTRKQGVDATVKRNAKDLPEAC